MKFINEIELKDKFGIYVITNLKNGKQYVGQTGQSFIKRYWHHKWKLNNQSHDNKYLQASWNKYGEDAFTFSVLYIASSLDDLDRLEEYYIDKLKTYISGYNMTPGGGGKRGCPMSDYAKSIVGAKNREHMLGRKASKETKKKMSLSSRHLPCSDKHREILRRRMTGRIVSEETRQKLRDRYNGSNSRFAKIDEATAANIKKRLIQGETQTEISKSLDISYGIVSSIRCGRSWNHVFVDGWDEWMLHHKDKIKSL